MGKYIWYNGEVPNSLKVTQVYGLIFTKDGRMMLRIPIEKGKKVFTLAGGTCETYDKDMEATLRRELIEEVNTTIGKPVIVGYQTFDNGKNELSFAQVRMVALIDKILPAKPDPDGDGQTYGRILVSPQRALELLNWGEPGKQMINETLRLLKKNFNISNYSENEEYV